MTTLIWQTDIPDAPVAEVMALSGRDLDCAIARDVFDHPVVHPAWPCARDPECGELAAQEYLEDPGSEYHPVYAHPTLDGAWPPTVITEDQGDWAHTMGLIGHHYAYVILVPFYTSDAATAATEVLEWLIAWCREHGRHQVWIAAVGAPDPQERPHDTSYLSQSLATISGFPDVTGPDWPTALGRLAVLVARFSKGAYSP